MNRSNRFLGFCPNDEKGNAFCQDIKAILKGTGFCLVKRGKDHNEVYRNCYPLNQMKWRHVMPLGLAKNLALYLRPCRGGNLCLSISALEAETLAVGMVLAVRKIHRLHGSSLNRK